MTIRMSYRVIYSIIQAHPFSKSAQVHYQDLQLIFTPAVSVSTRNAKNHYHNNISNKVHKASLVYTFYKM